MLKSNSSKNQVIPGVMINNNKSNFDQREENIVAEKSIVVFGDTMVKYG